MIDIYNLKGVPKEINSLLKLVQECKSCGDNENAANYLKTAIEKAEYHKVAPSIIVVMLRVYGDCLYWLTRHLDSMKAAYSAISYLKIDGDLDTETAMHMYLSNLFQEVGDYASSLEELQEAEKLCKLINNPKLKTWLKTTWAMYYSSVGESNRSINLNFEALAGFEELGDWPAVGGSYLNIGTAYSYGNDGQNAIKYLSKAVELGQTLNEEEV